MNSTNEREGEVFCAALNMSDPVRRHKFLDKACGSDSAFRARIESLLAVQPEAERFFDRAALALEVEPSPNQHPNNRTKRRSVAGLGNIFRW